MKRILLLILAMAMTATLGLQPASAEKHGKRNLPSFGGLFGGDKPTYFTLRPFRISVIRDHRVRNHVSLMVTLETTNEDNKMKIIQARHHLHSAFLYDLQAVMAQRRRDGRTFDSRVLKARLMRVAKRILKSDIVRDVLVAYANDRQFN